MFAEFSRVLRPGALLLVAFQADDGEEVDLHNPYGHVVSLRNYRHDPEQVSRLLDQAGMDIEVRLLRGPRDHEKTAQAFLLAQKRF